ncbi:glycogen/starch/alpha-glucan phosphorylase [Leptospira langatensis]|uniref:Alpha-1,4 glucan phosphorylase n=1 Tax=Leptospira langatensis TaxID=2484983 RepID=A0A5F1ZYA8_9LEPT|nr:glycogen/starch/alpha-glucan phosphorylase [Leptospira langatensis]TGK04184.1 glycogen/starch/alpha-glucan phosphorylase [Leptospira langatensis]TGL43664.1 glycogen/starch/alpha-glucan phosphorylase [Leptospira langatensis]
MSQNKHKKILDLFDIDLKIETDSLSSSIVKKLEYELGKYKTDTHTSDIYKALALSVRDLLISHWNDIQEQYRKHKVRKVYYLSIEYLLGTLLKTNLINLGIYEIAEKAVSNLGYDLKELIECEPDAALGNGGLGRLAACFLDSLATLDLPAQAAGIRYEYGIFRQEIRNGFQREYPENWLNQDNPWEIPRTDHIYPIQFSGSLKTDVDHKGQNFVIWEPREIVLAEAYDVFIPGYQTKTVTNLRLWKAKSSREFNLDYFNHGDYLRAIEDKQKSENISKVLYPNDSIEQGRELRLKQEYFLVCATLQDALSQFIMEEGEKWEQLPNRLVFHLNDTHPTLAIPEFMRLLIDRHRVAWDLAWKYTTECFAYTNHTIMPEALESWSVDLLESILPRHLQLIYEINFKFLEDLRKEGVSDDIIQKVSIVEEGSPKRIRMFNLALVASSSVNGVANLHTEILKKQLFREYSSLYPHKFINVTNGVAHRRWLLSANPALSDLITARIGDGWKRDLTQISLLEEFATDKDFCAQWARIKETNKQKLADLTYKLVGIKIDPNSLFDVQIKRIHEYKRQFLNVLRLVHDCQRLREFPSLSYAPRTVFFAGKAAPGYRRAKLIIKLIHAVGNVINNDPEVNQRLKVVFLPNYNVSLAEKIFPASDLSEQISAPGTEASGTGNMKFMLNGSLTVCTMDGANVEIIGNVGRENIYVFGNSVDELKQLRDSGYDPKEMVREDESLRNAVNAIRKGFFSKEATSLFEDLCKGLLEEGDPYYLLADFKPYISVQNQISSDYFFKETWCQKTVINAARAGSFSTDRVVSEYARKIWNLREFYPIP